MTHRIRRVLKHLGKGRYPFLGQLKLSRLHPRFQNVCSHFLPTKCSTAYLTCMSPFISLLNTSAQRSRPHQNYTVDGTLIYSVSHTLMAINALLAVKVSRWKGAFDCFKMVFICLLLVCCNLIFSCEIINEGLDWFSGIRWSFTFVDSFRFSTALILGHYLIATLYCSI